ncbi:MAG: carbohydrate binding domain-containing protein [Clostridia bacterium]|nr:carbohydrate binding domain-containing protein [Clostridia bacterium]
MKIRKLIALLATLLLVVTPMTAIVPASVSAEMGGDFPWTDASEKMLIEEILERDGLIDGIWFPWFNGGQTGHNLTGNDLMADYYNSSSTKNWDRVEMDYYGADKIYREIYNLKAMGYNIMAYGGSIFGEGVIFDENGDVLGIKEEYLNNARRLLNMCREIGMPVMWNVYFHDSSMPSYYGMEGWHVICQMLGNNEIADHYAERFVRPLCEMLAEYPDVVAIVSIADEPENQINDLGKGDHFDTKGREMYGVNQDDMIYFMQQINEVVREELPNVARTVASNNGNKTIYRDFDLDLMGHNQYTDGDSFKSIESLITDGDVILSEYNVGSVMTDDTAYANKLIQFRQWMIDNGYKGGFQWCWMPNSNRYSSYALQSSTTDPTAFRKTVALLKYFMDEYRAEYRGETLGLVAPVLYANAGDGQVKFLPSKLATKITVQRSDDGGSTWKTLASNVNQADYVNSDLVGCYTDSTTRPDSGYCYRIIASDDNGNTVTSEPNDLAGTDQTFKKTYTAPTYTKGKYYITSTMTESQAKLTSFGVEKNRPLSDAVNLIQNGSFESTGGQWNNSSFLQYAQVVEDATTPDGSKSLYFDTSAQSSEGWYTFTVTGLKANTEYTFSSFIKGAYLSDSNKGQASIGVIDPDTGKYMFYWEYFRSYPRASRETKQMYPTAYDDEWHIRSVTFNTGSLTTATIALYGYSSQIWVDGLALFETANGMKYENGESSKAIVSTEYSPASGATNAVSDPLVNDASYWNTGAGYKQGFMSIASGKLTYTASSDPVGVRYTKWIDVKPGTDYYYSYTVNVTSAGNGRVALLDNAMLLPNEVVTTAFSSTGTKTVTGRISTGKYDKLGLCVVDLGGVATIDNIYLYEGDASVVLPTTPSFDGYIINGDFEIGSSNNWENLWNNNTVAIVAGRDSAFAIEGTANSQYAQVRQKITVEPDTDYIIEVWAKNVSSTNLIVKDMADANLKQVSLQGSGDTWTKTTLEFNSGSNTWIHLGFMGTVAGATWTVDDVKMYVKPTESNDGYIINGDFEIGTTSGWENVWGSNTVTVVTGHDSNYGMKVNANLYTVVREAVTVEANTTYVIEAWVKDCSNAVLLVKDSADSVNILNYSLPTGSTWTKVTAEFNSGSNTTVYVGFMGGATGATYTVDDVKMYKKEEPVGVQNGDFENGDADWTYGSGSYAIVSDAHGGNGALQLTNPGQWGSAAEQTIKVEPNTSYTITWWYKATPGTGVFNLYTMNASGYANLTAEGGQNYMNNYTGDWQQGTYVVNSGSAAEMILKWSTEASNPGTILIDDIVVTKTEDYECTHAYTAAVTQQPTCGTTGVRTYTCSLCGDSYTETIPATGAHKYDNDCDTSCNVCGTTRTVTHTYSGSCDTSCNVCGALRLLINANHTYSYDCDATCDVCGFTRTGVEHYYVGTVTKQPTCTEPGVKTYTCYWGCGDSYTEAIEPTGEHAYKAVVTEPDCVNGGYTTYTCSACGDSYVGDYTAALGHSWIAADCDTAKTCSVCGATEGEALGHSYKAVVTEPDCVNGGYTTYTCTACGDSYVGNCTDALGHSWIAADCDTPKTCSVCGEVDGDALGHTYDNDCDADCNTCGATRTPADHKYVESIVANANCGYDGMAKHTCSVCGDSYITAIPATGAHKYSNDCDNRCNVCNKIREVGDHRYVGVQTTAPTCTETGVMTYTCSSCGVSYTETIPVIAHSYNAVVTEPDCVNGGYTTYTCTACGDSYKGDYTAALGHTAGAEADCENDQVCTVCGEVLKEALGHSWIAADCYAPKHCEVCGETEGDVAHGNIIHVEALAPTCTALGNIEYWYCETCGQAWLDEAHTMNTNLMAVKLPMADHTYDNEYDADCNVCGAVREATQAPITFSGNSVTEEIKTGAGLAFKFDVAVNGMQTNGTTAIYEGATVNGYKLISMGAVVTNGVSTLDIPAVYLCDLEADSASFAVRVIKIPADKLDVEITATPYIVVEIDGVQTTIYGEAQTSSYNETLNG